MRQVKCAYRVLEPGIGTVVFVPMNGYADRAEVMGLGTDGEQIYHVLTHRGDQFAVIAGQHQRIKLAVIGYRNDEEKEDQIEHTTEPPISRWQTPIVNGGNQGEDGLSHV